MNRIPFPFTIVLPVVIAFLISACSTSHTMKDREQPRDPQQSNTTVVNNDEKDPQQVTKDNDKPTTPVEEKETEPVVIADALSIVPEVKRQHQLIRKCSPSRKMECGKVMGVAGPSYYGGGYMQQLPPGFNTEEYDRIYENRFLKVTDKPLSTFSIDVDAASYSNMRRFLMNNSLPPKDAIRIEEMINYFTYNYKAPKDGDPFSITTEMGPCPWDEKHKLVHIGLQGMKVEMDSLPPSNLVFLLDVSGSMDMPDKLPLLKMAFKMLVKNLRKEDKVAIAVYAGAAGLVLPSTSGDKSNEIISALENLRAGGSTAGGAGIQLAYKTAKENFLKDGNNRVILATDGDFNVGASSDGELVRMIEEKRKEGIFLTVLGFGTGNYKDSKMEKLADKGNGNYAYIDNLLEAKKVFVNEMGGTLLTIAKDVKIQVEFNPASVQAYRLIGYENRKLKDEDFNDDKKDAGELGAGHSVTALYEIIPHGVKADLPDIDDLKYQSHKINPAARTTGELLTVKFRYKPPKEDTSKLIVKVLKDKTSKKMSQNLQFSAAVAGFGMLLRDSEYKGNLTYSEIIEMAKAAKGQDNNGYRAEFIKLVERAEVISGVKG